MTEVKRVAVWMPLTDEEATDSKRFELLEMSLMEYVIRQQRRIVGKIKIGKVEDQLSLRSARYLGLSWDEFPWIAEVETVEVEGSGQS